MDNRQKPMGIGLLGFGTVGGGVYEFVQARSDMKIEYVLSRRPRPELRCTVTDDFSRIVADPAVEVVIEAIGGLHPAYEYVTAALRAGKHVITANKLLIAAHYRELVTLCLLYTSRRKKAPVLQHIFQHVGAAVSDIERRKEVAVRGLVDIAVRILQKNLQRVLRRDSR